MSRGTQWLNWKKKTQSDRYFRATIYEYFSSARIEFPLSCYRRRGEIVRTNVPISPYLSVTRRRPVLTPLSWYLTDSVSMLRLIFRFKLHADNRYMSVDRARQPSFAFRYRSSRYSCDKQSAYGCDRRVSVVSDCAVRCLLRVLRTHAALTWSFRLRDMRSEGNRQQSARTRWTRNVVKCILISFEKIH